MHTTSTVQGKKMCLRDVRNISVIRWVRKQTFIFFLGSHSETYRHTVRCFNYYYYLIL